MDPIKVKDGAATVTIYEAHPKPDKVAHQLCWRVGKERHRQQVSSKREAITEARKIAKSLSEGDDALTQITNRELTYYRELEAKLDGIPLHVAVNAFLNSTSSADLQKKRRFSLVVEEYLSHISPVKPGLEMGFIRHHLHSLARHYTGPIDALDRRLLHQYFAERGWGLQVCANHLQSVVALFRYAQKKGYLPKGPVEAEFVGKMLTENTSPQIYTPEEVALLMKFIRSDGIPFLALGAFAGLRPKEIKGLLWGDIDFKKNVIRRIGRGPGEYRVVPLMPNLATIIRPHKEAARDRDPVVPIHQPHKEFTKKTIDAINADIEKRTGKPGTFRWKDNGLRKSFIAYHLALYDNATLTADLVGGGQYRHSSAFLGLATKAQAEKFFALT